MCAGRVEQEDGVRRKCDCARVFRTKCPFDSLYSLRSRLRAHIHSNRCKSSDCWEPRRGLKNASTSTPAGNSGPPSLRMTQGENQFFQQPRCIMEGATVYSVDRFFVGL